MALLGANGMPLSAPQTPPTQDQTPDETPAPVRVTTAFLVSIAPNGRVSVTDDLAAPIVPARKPTFDDIIGAAANVQAELTARKAADMAAATTIQTQMSMARQAQEASLNAQVAQQLAGGRG